MVENKESERKRILCNTSIIGTILIVFVLFFIWFFKNAEGLDAKLAEKEQLKRDKQGAFADAYVNDYIASVQKEMRTVEPTDIRLDVKRVYEDLHGDPIAPWKYEYEVTFSSTRIDELSKEYVDRKDYSQLFSLLRPSAEISDKCFLYKKHTLDRDTIIIHITKQYADGLRIQGDHLYELDIDYKLSGNRLDIDSETLYFARYTPDSHDKSHKSHDSYNHYYDYYDYYDYYEYDNAYDYYDAYDFYLDNEDEFEDYEEAEDYYYERWGE